MRIDIRLVVKFVLDGNWFKAFTKFKNPNGDGNALSEV